MQTQPGAMREVKSAVLRAKPVCIRSRTFFRERRVSAEEYREIDRIECADDWQVTRDLQAKGVIRK